MPPTELHVDEPDLTFIRVDQQTRLQFGGTEVVIEGEFTLVVDGVLHRLDPSERGDLGPLLGIYPSTLRTLRVEDDGTLHLALESGAVVRVPPDPRYEAWQVSGPGTRLVVCGPGGSLAVWE